MYLLDPPIWQRIMVHSERSVGFSHHLSLLPFLYDRKCICETIEDPPYGDFEKRYTP